VDAPTSDDSRVGTTGVRTCPHVSRPRSFPGNPPPLDRTCRGVEGSRSVTSGARDPWARLHLVKPSIRPRKSPFLGTPRDEFEQVGPRRTAHVTPHQDFVRAEPSILPRLGCLPGRSHRRGVTWVPGSQLTFPLPSLVKGLPVGSVPGTNPWILSNHRSSLWPSRQQDGSQPSNASPRGMHDHAKTSRSPRETLAVPPVSCPSI